MSDRGGWDWGSTLGLLLVFSPILALAIWFPPIGLTLIALAILVVGVERLRRKLFEAPAPPSAPDGPTLPDAEQQVIVWLTTGDLEAADALAAEAIARGERVEWMWFHRGIAALMRDDEAAALHAFEQANSPEAANSLALLLARRGEPDRARALADDALARLPNDPITIRGAVTVYLRAGDVEGARRIAAGAAPSDRIALEQLIESPHEEGGHVFPFHAKLAAEAATALLDAQRIAEALPLLQRAVALDPGEPSHAVELGWALSQLGRDEQAIRVYDASIERGGAGLLLKFNRGNCHRRLGRLDAALADLEASVALWEDWHDARVNLAGVLLQLGRTDDAVAQLEELRRRGAPPELIAALEMALDG